MPAVEANEGESDEAKRALDILGLRFTDSRASRQPPRAARSRIALAGIAFASTAFPVLHSQYCVPLGWAAGRERGFSHVHSAPNTCSATMETGADGDDHERRGSALCNPR